MFSRFRSDTADCECASAAVSFTRRQAGGRLVDALQESEAAGSDAVREAARQWVASLGKAGPGKARPLKCHAQKTRKAERVAKLLHKAAQAEASGGTASGGTGSGELGRPRGDLAVERGAWTTARVSHRRVAGAGIGAGRK